MSELEQVANDGDGAVALGNAVQRSSEAILAHATLGTAAHARMVRSKANTRKKARDLSELKALVRANGVLQNLVCFAQQQDGEPTGLLEVAAGDGRWQVVGELIAEGDLPEDYQLPYMLVAEHEAVLVSLAENLGRAPMHPADIFDAMLTLAQQQRSVADIALAFGVSELTVRRRLKLANVAPRLFALYRADQASYEQMAALAVSDDHAAQLAAWDGLAQWERQPQRLRRLLTAHCVSVRSDRVVRYVGVKTYEKTGGTVARDLFSEDNDGYIEDVALLDRLANDRLQRVAARLHGEGWLWIDVRCRMDAAELAVYGRVRTEVLAPNAEQQAKLDQLARRAAALAAETAAGAEDAVEDGAALRELAAIELEQGRIANELRQPDRADRALAGTLVTLDDKGKPSVLRGLIRPQDKARMAKAAAGAEGGGPRARQRGPHSERLTELLSAQRTLALRAELVRQPEVALRVLAHHLIRSVFYADADGSAVQIALRLPQLPGDAEHGPAWEAWEAQRGALVGLLPAHGDSVGLMEWLTRQPRSILDDCIAFCTACAVNGVQQREQPRPAVETLARTVRLDMHRWWKPTAQDYFAHVRKEQMLAVVAQAVSPAKAVPLEKLRKDAAAEAAALAVADSGWLPPLLAGVLAASEAVQEDADDEQA
ncbi:ParB/RepB/Spo0J family partition protein [Duganella sp. BuS-21]|uniref:ParB/RepB/Spo0J family partition protein n=1 Tax=Duganella sp. BuS-21 TaxID=2943848 RepID=UPI0035A72A95